jgi:hypothetical protein
MTIRDRAQRLAKNGFYVFPLEPNGKKPAIGDWPSQSSRDAQTIDGWFTKNPNYNIGIYTGRFGDGDQALIVIDVDNKNGKNGDEAVVALELDGNELPATLEQSTPSGGRHMVYLAPYACKQGVDVLGEGLDIRSRGGYIVGPGSVIDGKTYTQINGHGQMVAAPAWLVDRLGKQIEVKPQSQIIVPNIDVDRAEKRARDYLNSIDSAVEGSRNHAAFKAAAQLKDYGCDENKTFELLAEIWNANCSPPLEEDELRQCVASAYKYGRDPQGSKAPEGIFEATESVDNRGTPIEVLNEEFAFVKRGAFILHETTDEDGNYVTEHLSVFEFNTWLANRKIQIGDKTVALSKMWLESGNRRQYEGVTFSPCKDLGPRFYNLWRGFTVSPADTSKHKAVDLFLDHALNNVCGGDEKLCHYLIGYFAHMVQKPWEKPLVALCFQGRKGTGKNALVERVGALFGPHFLVADDSRYLLSNFNSHLESNLFFVLDEASWAGDKRAEGRLKGLITGADHVIERKGKEPYTVNNLSRICIIGNEDWLVPATQDERRFVVFNVSDARRQDREYFKNMRVWMEQGGYAFLLRYLMDYDIKGFDVDDAPITQGLINQKHQSLEPLQEWWLDCLENNQLVGCDWESAMPELIPTNRALDAFCKWTTPRKIRSRLQNRNTFYKELLTIAKSMSKVRTNPKDPNDASHSFKHSGIDKLRDDWDEFIGGKHEWSK